MNKFQDCAFWLLSDKQYKDAENLVPGRLTETPSGTPKLYGPWIHGLFKTRINNIDRFGNQFLYKMFFSILSLLPTIIL